MIDIVNFKNSVVNKTIDIDNAYGHQCYDLAAKWIIDNNWGSGFYCAWSGGVKDLFYNFNEIYGIDRSKIELITNNPSDINQIPNAGDIVIWNIGVYGHIGVCISSNIDTMETIEQNVGNGDGDGYDDRVIVKIRDYSNVLGWVREIKNIEIIDNDMKFKESLKKSLTKYPWFYTERAAVMNNAIDNDGGDYIARELDMFNDNYEKELKRANNLEKVIFDLEKEKKVLQDTLEKNIQFKTAATTPDKTKIDVKSIEKVTEIMPKFVSEFKSLTSSDKRWYESKKFLALLINVACQIIPILQPEYTQISNNILIIGLAYLGVQSAIDYKSK